MAERCCDMRSGTATSQPYGHSLLTSMRNLVTQTFGLHPWRMIATEFRVFRLPAHVRQQAACIRLKWPQLDQIMAI